MLIVKFENGMLVQRVWEFDPERTHPMYLIETVYGPGHYALTEEEFEEVNRRANENARAWREECPSDWREPHWVGL